MLIQKSLCFYFPEYADAGRASLFNGSVSTNFRQGTMQGSPIFLQETRGKRQTRWIRVYQKRKKQCVSRTVFSIKLGCSFQRIQSKSIRMVYMIPTASSIMCFTFRLKLPIHPSIGFKNLNYLPA
ncbi:hypothetical protein CUU66_03665 [Peribacillus deserti]|uniref:Uncharacterized protein n=1 Tax=Peribacillus deserti TaxID=673318 RepID=A0A2N5MAB3_9BACI|nr:hypothetical protein CUU66_03665 [Peribacillus deserti]